MHSTRPLVPTEYHLIHWHSIDEMHLIMWISNISDGFELSGGAFYWSIGTNSITFN